jgi:uncharacterized protein YjbI with pentapeptide repeats
MANQEHRDILMQGVEGWNQWRGKNRGIRPDLSGADLNSAKLSDANLSGANLSGATLRGANLIRADLSGADLSGATLRGANLIRADLSSADLSGVKLGNAFLNSADLRYATLRSADLSYATLRSANLSYATLRYATLSGADLSGAGLNSADLSGADLIRADLRGATLIGADLNSAKLNDANLIRADLSGAKLSDADLSGAKLSDADLSGAKLSDADLSDADLRGAKFSGAKLNDANLSGADLSGANLSGADLQRANLSNVVIERTVFADNDLSATRGLEVIMHEGPSHIGIDALVKSKGQIPEWFLRGCGLSDWQIEEAKLYNPNLSNEQINDIQYRIHDLRVSRVFQISPLFISYSHTDSLFVDAIEKRLTEQGVRFWRDVHHAKAGRLENQIDKAIAVNDVVLLILSEHSTNSDWVEHEARRARAKEKQIGKDALCPVALDDSWKTCRWPERLRDQIMEYNILDFSNWQDDVDFQKMFGKLLEGLNLFYK